MNTIKYIAFSMLPLLFFSSCRKKKPAEPEATRSFYMGTTTWPADFTETELNKAYSFIQNNCDIVSHHFDDGIPWKEMENNQPLPLRFQQEVQTRKLKTPAGKKIFLSVSALNLTRKEKAGYYDAASVADSIKSNWKALPFNHTKVVTAYIHYINKLISEFNPVYVNFGVESNLSQWPPADFLLYKDFIAQVYVQLKGQHPSLPLMISFMVEESTTALQYASQLTAYTDFLALSAYPYVHVSSSAAGNTNPALFPADFFTRFINLAPAKPLAFAETGYIAENLVIPSFSLNKQGSEVWQKDYLEMICQLCNDKKAKLLIWFCHKDYDAGSATMQALGLYQDLFGLWEDTGLKDENDRERPAFTSWQQWMNRSKTE